MPSSSSSCRWVSSAPGEDLRLTPPAALITRCHGSAVADGSACSA
jgi:hypothetical protein